MMTDRSQSLPQSIDFYSLGQATLTPEPTAPIAPDQFSDLQTYGYAIRGDLGGAILCFFRPDEDASVCAELGNTVASQLVTELSRREDLDLMITPPQKIEEKTFLRLASASSRPGERTTKTYEWKTHDQTTKFVVWLIWGQNVE